MIYHLLIPKYTENILWLIDSCIIGSILYSLHPPEKRYIGGLITSIHYLEYGFASGNQVNMRSLDRGLVQFDWYPYKKQKFGRRSAPRRMSFEDEDRDWSDAGISQETPKLPADHQKPSMIYKTDSPEQIVQEIRPANTLTLTSGLQNCEVDVTQAIKFMKAVRKALAN